MSRWALPALLATLVLVTGAPAARAQDTRRDPPPPPPTTQPVVTRAPVLLQAVAPEYPAAALAAGKQAEVPVRIHIDENGLVTKVEVIPPGPVGDGFDAAAIAAAMQYVFEPAEIDGKPAAIQVETTIYFVIEEVPEPEEPEEPAPDTGDDPQQIQWDNQEIGHAGDPAKPVTISGEVLERGTRSKLAGVIVSLVQLQLDTVTDEHGRFYFHGVPAGEWDVLAIDDRYDRLERKIDLAAREQVDVRLWMRPRGGNPYETIIEGEREQLEVTRRSLQRRQLTTVPGTFGDPIRVIQALPGLARAPFSLGILLIRGSNPDDTGIFVDGHRVPLLFHFLGGPSFLNAELVESIDLYPSGFPARFGRAHGGVVAIESRPSKSDGIHGSADVDLLDAGAYLRAPIGKHASVTFAGRRSYLDTFLPLVLPEPDPGAQLTVVPVYWDWQARTDLDLGAEGRASVFMMQSSDRLDVLSKDPEAEEDLALNAAIDFFRIIGMYERPLAGKLRLSLSPAWGRDAVRFGSGASESSSPYLSADIVQDSISYRARVRGPLSARLTLDAGIDMESRVTRYRALVPDDSDIRGGSSQGIDIPPEQLALSVGYLAAGLHADLAIDLGPVRLVPGLRADAVFLSSHVLTSVDPRITARWAMDRLWTLKGYLGWFHQPPQPEAADPTFGNPDIEMEDAVHLGTGVEWRPTRLWLADLEVYWIDRNHLVGFTADGTLDADGNLSTSNFVNQGYGFTYGLEAMIKREITDTVYGWLSYTYSHSERALPGGELLLSTFDQTHVANLVASWRPGAGFELGARWRLATGRPYTPIVDSTFDADEGGYDPIGGGARSQRFPFFSQVDVRLEKTWLFELWSMGLYLDVQNALYTDNVEALDYDYRYRETSKVSGVPILPTLGIRGQW